MREKMYRFMQGRYGNDNLNRFLMIVTLVFFVISIFTVPFFNIIGLAAIGCTYFRMLSRNTYKRSAENQVYLQYEYKVKGFLGRLKRDVQQRKTHHIYKCPSCQQKIRIPRGKGNIEITCPKCRQAFIKKS